MTSERTLRYRGDSMFPFFQEGDLLYYQEGAPDELQVGDIPVVKQAEDPKIMVHRIIGFSADPQKPFITKGDNMFKRDGLSFRLADVRGKVVAVERAGQKRKLNLHQGRWRAVLSKYNISPCLARVLRLVRRGWKILFALV